MPLPLVSEPDDSPDDLPKPPQDEYELSDLTTEDLGAILEWSKALSSDINLTSCELSISDP